MADSKRLRAEFIYSVENLLIDRSLLGQSVTFKRDGKDFEIAFPKEPMDESDDPSTHGFDRFEDEFDFPLPEGEHELYGRSSISPTSTIASVDVVRVSLTWTVNEAELRGRRPIDVIEDVATGADETFARLFDVLRSRGKQPWMGLTGTRHEHLGGDS